MTLLLVFLFIVGVSLTLAMAMAMIQVLWEPCATLGRLIADWLVDKFSPGQD